jgi:general secretion pathway protein I
VTRTRGFTLLEMIVASVILAVAVVGLMSGVSGALRNASRLTTYDRVVQLARLRMNDLLVDETLPRDQVVSGGFDAQIAGNDQAGWRARLTEFQPPFDRVPGEIAVERIELEVWWMAGTERRTFTLEAFRPHTLTAQELSHGA